MDKHDIALELIDPPLVPRQINVDTPEFRELVLDIRDRGLLQPLVVNTVGTRYRLMAGHRRLLACRAADLLDAPCNVLTVPEETEIDYTLRENLHREDMSPVDEGAAFGAMTEGLGLSVQQIAERVGKSVAYVRDRLKLVTGDPDVMAAVRDGRISLSVALELLRCEHAGDRANLLYHAARSGWNARSVRNQVNKYAADRAALPPTADPETPLVSREVAPVLTAVCQMHRGEVGLGEVLLTCICTRCYPMFEALSADVAAAAASAQEDDPRGPTHGSGSEAAPGVPGARGEH